MGIKIEILGFLALWWHACCICLTRKRDTCQRYEATIASAYPRVWDMMDRTSILGDAIEHLKELAHNVCRRNSEYTHVFLVRNRSITRTLDNLGFGHPTNGCYPF